MPPEHSNGVTLAARGLTRRFGPRVAVADVDLELRRGEVLGFLGPNGAGKTTTMRMLTGTLAPSAGSVAICGIDLLERPLAAKQRIGYLPETPPLYRELTVDAFLQLAARLHRVPRDERDAAVARARERCGLATVGPRLIGALSRGYQQRVGLAQAIVHRPDVLILDEPTAGLDPNQIRDIRALIRELGGDHSVVLSTHILPEVETVCDRVQILHRGRVVFDDTLAELRSGSGRPSVLLELADAPAPEAIAALPGVARVEALACGEFRVWAAADADPVDTLVAAAVAQGWRLRRLTPWPTTLEEVFARLTADAPAETGEAAA
ncbi:MAG TPA: ABC transporter ATP-binding protein [Pelomicrobium sp.]|nr:ABC transporter ATP-binding protein [Pelomicrobium sp.]